ncbi:MAG: HDOD domain-containing protein [Rhodoferax sp.]|uniref:EAL and HDOD domain-containing protein n=1 Tax=Rhodoferax sp. TaxID=50421 RepID=UPI0017C4A826|nr:HDOD domain-containing protein [Rhodoferax sp.]NMM13133.1 HDOD domain-containing protein [Rhodoferax sp.]NMM19411.1 HDOD domain-containing protein [Rhodoferax sp.]
MSNTPEIDPASETLPQNSIAIARQAILDHNRDVFGYELFDRSLASTTHTAASDAAMLFNVLSHADSEVLIDRKNIFINCTHETLAGGHLELIQPDRVVLEIPPLAVAATDEIEARLQTLTDMAKRGFRLAFDHTVLTRPYASWLPLASFIKLDLSKLPPEAVSSVIHLAQTSSTAQLIAEKVETAAQFEQVAGLGLKLFQGYWFAKPVLFTGQTVRPAQAAIIQLINLVRKQASTAEIEEVLKRDPTLSFNLLRFINSSGFGLSCEITSFRHAVMILGLKKLFRWAALLLTTSRTTGVAPAVGNMAVVRGRLMELLATELLPPDECDNAFVVGVFSLLDTMLGIPLEKALESISLPETVVNALLHHTGVLAPFLELTKACENADDEAFGRTADALHLNNRQVNWAHLQALAWAETLAD